VWFFLTAPPPDFGKQNLHRLFRLLDSNNDHQLGMAEFQNGLITMGFRMAEDSAVVTRLIAAIDREHTGKINEKDFIEYFWKLKKSDLEDRLKSWQDANRAEVEVVSYSVVVSGGGEGFCVF